jgi:hypothetical protein
MRITRELVASRESTVRTVVPHSSSMAGGGGGMTGLDCTCGTVLVSGDGGLL